MKKLATLLVVPTFGLISNAQVITYDIPIGQTIGLQQTTGDICSAPWTVEEAFQATLGNQWGCTWTSAGSGAAVSVEITLGFTVTDGNSTYPTTLNGVASNNVNDGPPKSCEPSTIMTWVIDPSSYNAGGTNTFMVDFAGSDSVSQLDNLPFIGDPYMRITVDYSPCQPIDTTVTENGGTLTSNASSMSYQWINCESGLEETGETSISFTPTSSGNYAVVISDTASGCSDTSECTNVSISGLDDILYSKVNLYPNPTNLSLTMDVSSFPNGSNIYVYDVHGKLILTTKISGSMNSYTLDVGDLSKGLYQVVLSDGQNQKRASFVKD